MFCTKMQSFQETPVVSGKKTMNIHEHLNLNPTYHILSLRNAPFLRVAGGPRKSKRRRSQKNGTGRRSRWQMRPTLIAYMS
jgi:hypothetical protein